MRCQLIYFCFRDKSPIPSTSKAVDPDFKSPVASSSKSKSKSRRGKKTKRLASSHSNSDDASDAMELLRYVNCISIILPILFYF